MDKFEASNGITVELNQEGEAFEFRGASGMGPVWFSSGEIDALREFFRAERDEELGRWRWPENPANLVYPRGDRGTSGRRRVVVIDEASGFHSGLLVEGYTDNPAARAYFDAQPESKPWHDAKTSEVWVLTIDGDESAWTVNNTGVFENPDSTLALDNRNITTARRIWPEEVES